MIKAKAIHGGKLSGGAAFKRFFDADGGDGVIGFVGKNLILFIVIAAAILTTLFAPIARFPANDSIAKVGLVFSFLISTEGLHKGNADRFLTSLLLKLPDRLTVLVTVFGGLILGAVLTPLGAVLVVVPAVKPLLIGKAEAAIEKKPVDYITVGIYLTAFILCVLSALGILDIIVTFCSVVLAAVILDSDTIKKIDYGLLVIIFLYTVVSWNVLRTDRIELPDSSIIAAGLYAYRQYLTTAGAKPLLGLLIFTGVGIILVLALSALAAI
ncbi:MAG: hypothetical protein LBL98_01475 [Ruminococcus sp.]|jgi:hypothetical protein|nr:hypothetical protein [Ruminococcus sp.]